MVQVAEFKCLPTSAAEAKRLGLTRYWSKTECPKGHGSERLVSNRSCVRCIRITRKRQLAANPDKYRLKNQKRTRAWRRRNPWYDRKKRAKRDGAPGNYGKGDIRKLLDNQHGRCLCGKLLELGYHIDHKTPISRGGSNWPRNLQLLCAPCNLSKGAKTQAEWKATRGF